MTYKLYTWLFILAIFASCTQPKEKEAEQKLPEKTKDGITALNEQISKSPNDASLLFRRSDYFFQKNNNKQAFDDITKALSIDSTKDEYYLLLANVNFKGLQIQSAMDAFKKAIEINSSNGEAHLKLAELYLYVKAYPNCITEANEALKIDKNNAKAYFIKAFAYKETGDTLRALSTFQTAVEVKSDYYDAYIQMGNILTVRQDPLALQYYNNALQIRPTSTEALYNRGLFYQDVGETDMAINDYNAIIKIDPAYADAHYNLGYIDCAFKEDFNSAIKHFTDAIRINSDYVEAFYNRGLCFESLNDKQSAMKDYIAALGIVPTYKLAKDRLNNLTKNK